MKNITTEEFQKLSTKDKKTAKDLYELGQLYDGLCTVDELYTVDGKDIRNPEDAKAMYESAAGKGLASAALALGLLHEKNEQIDEAIQWFTTAADLELGDGLALYHLGKLEETYKKDLKTAVAYYKRAIASEESFSIDAAKRMIYFYENGCLEANIQQNPQKIFEFYTKLAEQHKDPESMYELARIYEQKKDTKNAFSMYEKAANAKHSQAAYWLARYYESKLRQSSFKTIIELHKSSILYSSLQYYNIAFGEMNSLSGEMLYHWGQFLQFLTDVKDKKITKLELQEFTYSLRITWTHFKSNLKPSDCFIKAAEKSHLESLNLVAKYYEDGEYGLQKDPKKAFEYYLKASNSDNLEAKFNLAHCYEYGIGIEQDEEKAFDLFVDLTKKNYLPAFNRLGRAFEFGFGCDLSLETAFSWYEKGADRGDEFGLKNLERCHFKYNYQPGVIRGTKLAWEIYLNKKVYEDYLDPQCKNPEEMSLDDFIEYEKSIKENPYSWRRHVRLMSIYGGEGKKLTIDILDPKKRNVFMKKAVQLGYPFLLKQEGNDFSGVCKTYLVYMQYSSDLLTRQKAQDDLIKLTHKTEPKRHIAIKYLARYYETRDPEKALQCYRDVAITADPEAQYKAGYLYEYGIGTQKDLKKAKTYYGYAAENGNLDAKCKLASFLMLDKQEEAFLSYENLSEQGHADSTYYLAECYAKGLSVEQDNEKAKKLYKLAAEQGSFYAVEHIEDEDVKRKLIKLGLEKGDRDALFHRGYEYLL
jgi:TPR repeat protein